jgi:hypothetical protein
MPNLIEASGGSPQKQPKYVPIFLDRAFTGLYSQRAVLHDPSDVYTARFYGGRPDALLTGRNVELTNRLTLQRRPGLSAFSAATYPTPPNTAFSFQLTNGTIQVIIDTGSTGLLSLTGSSGVSGLTTVYNGTITGGGSNAYVGLIFRVSGFTNANNNGDFFCTASSTTTLTLANPNGVAELTAATTFSSGAVYIDNQNGTKTFLLAKSPAAGQTHFVAVAGILYMGDGVDTKKYTPGNPNGAIWNWGIVAPTQQPNVVITPSGAAAVTWQANTIWSTVGLIFDSASGTTQQLNSVTQNTAPAANSQNSTTFGRTGPGGPVWNQAPGGTTTDGSVTWQNRGPIVLWTPGTTYGNASTGPFSATTPCIVYDPGTKSCYIQSNSNPGTRVSGQNYPKFKPSSGAHTDDGQVVWIWLGPGGIPGQWQASHAYPQIGTVSDNDVVSSVSEPTSLNAGLPPNSTPIYWQVAEVGGTSAATGSPSFAARGNITSDGDISWLSLGVGTWQANTTPIPWSTSGAVFTAIKDSNGNAQVCITSNGPSGAIQPTWKSVYGKTTLDGGTSQNPNVVWVCVGKMLTWTASTIWELPVVGFSPPTSSSPFGGSSIIDSNGNVEFVINSGLGGAVVPVWNTTVGGTFATSSTTDNQATWYNLAVSVAQSLSWTKGHVYAYSYKARSLTDFFSVPALITNAQGITSNVIPTPPGLGSPLPAPLGSETGAISTASPVFTITGGNTGAVNTISGIGSIDPQVDTIVIWRDADGGGLSNMFELTEIPAPPPIAGKAQPWSFKDFLPDVPTNLFPGLNVLIPAPINHQNDPPPSAYLPMVYNFQRIWGANGLSVPFSGGPDVPTGNPNEAFLPADELPFLAPVTRLVRTPQGIITFLTDSIEVIAGGPLTSSFFSVTVGPGIGLVSYNALDVFAGEIYFFAADNQFRVMSPSLNVSNAGFPVGDQFANHATTGIQDATWNPAKVYVAIHQNGIDNMMVVSDGSTGWYRLNPRQVPGAAQGPEPVWSPFAAITNGAKMVQSVETQPGIKKLLVGSTLPGQNILNRDLSVFTDNGTAYDAFFVMGSITLAHPGQIALLKFLEFDFSGISYTPTVSYLLNEISGTFTPFTTAPQFDPPSIYGQTIFPTSYSPNRYYFSSNALLARCRHMQVKVDFGTTSNGDELYNMTIFGRMMVET